jgi:AGZA family xanthine/uracil permease-like MFS transporter
MTTVSASLPGAGLLERYFGFAARGTTLARDTAAGATTFVVMSYIIFVNPIILTGATPKFGPSLAFGAVLTSTCLVAGVMSMLMGITTNYAYAIAPGMGLNAVVAYGLVASGKASFPEAMGLVVLEGVAMVLLAVTGLREMIFKAIPLELKKAIAIGIGLFIAFIGLYNSGIIQSLPASAGQPVTLGNFTTWPIFVTFFGIIFTFALRAMRVKGDLIIGIIGTTVVATIINSSVADHRVFGTSGPAYWPGWHHLYAKPDFSLLGKISMHSFSSSQLGVVASLVWVFSLFLSDFFDFSGTAIGVGKQAGYVDKDGNIPNFKRALVVDGLAAIAGGSASASSATTYIESGSGVAAGGRTGWVAVVAGILFFPFMFISPLIGMVPAQATAAALIVVGWLMISTLTEMEGEAEGAKASKLAGIDFHDLAIGLSAALAIMIMPFTYSITNGIGFGFITYTLICAASRQWKRIHPFMWVVTAAFVLYFLIPLLQQHYSFFGGHLG